MTATYERVKEILLRVKIRHGTQRAREALKEGLFGAAVESELKLREVEFLPHTWESIVAVATKYEKENLR